MPRPPGWRRAPLPTLAAGEGADAMFGAMRAALAPGGTLLVVTHHPSDLETTVGRPDLPELFFTAEELAGPMDPAEWEVLVAHIRPRHAHDGEGREVTVRDTVLRARRRG